MKRFYRDVSVDPAEGGWRVMLDGRGIRTAQGAAQIAPTQTLAGALAAEWAAQGEEIDLATFFFRDLADYAIDIATADPAAEIPAILRYAETDTLCYRADPEEPLYPRQQELWEPLLEDCETRHAIRFERVSGILHRPQPPETLARLGAVLREQTPFTLAATRTLASLAASLVVALAALEEGANAEKLWAAANAEEDWQAEQWGWEWTAEEKRARKLSEFSKAMEFARLARETPA